MTTREPCMEDFEPDEPECLECMDSGEVNVGGILMPCPCCPAYENNLRGN